MLILFQWWLAGRPKIQIFQYCSPCIKYTQNKMLIKLQNIIIHHTGQWITLNLHFNQERLHNIKGQITAGRRGAAKKRSDWCTLLWDLWRVLYAEDSVGFTQGPPGAAERPWCGRQRDRSRAAEWEDRIINRLTSYSKSVILKKKFNILGNLRIYFVRWEDRYHSRVCVLNTELESGGI